MRAPAAFEDVDARGVLQRAFETGHALVFKLFFGDDADGLGNFPRRKYQSRSRTHRGYGVAVLIFGTQAAVFANHIDLLQFSLLYFFSGLNGLRQRGKAERQGAEFEKCLFV